MYVMKTMLKHALLIFLISTSILCHGQEIRTLLGSSSTRSSGGYGALTNKFTKIGGEYANLSGVSGGWYINHKFTLGLSVAALTSNIYVPDNYSVIPNEKMSYEYGQFGLLTEYVIGSNRAIHVGIQLFSGAGFTSQYKRNDWDNYSNEYNFDKRNPYDTHWFIVTEPGINIEMNLLKWMRFCPGVSYRSVFLNQTEGLKDKDINGTSFNLTLKFGKF